MDTIDTFDLDALTTATPRQIEAVVRDHNATVDNLVRRYQRAADALQGAATISTDSVGNTIVRQEQIETTQTALVAEEVNVIDWLSRILPVVRRAEELLFSREVTLDEADLATAAARKLFIEEDVSRLSFDALRDQIAAALRRQDRPALFLYLRSVPGRLDQQRSVQAGEPGMVAWGDTGVAGDTGFRSAIAQMLTEAQALLTVETRHAGYEEAVALRDKILDLQNRIGRERTNRVIENAQTVGAAVAW